MVEATDRAADALERVAIHWVPLARAGEPGSLPGPAGEVPDREADAIAGDPISQAYRSLFWDVDVDPTKRRPAGEALARRARDGLPEIHPLVDAYNLASAATLVPLSAFDREALAGPPRLDAPREGDALDAIGEADPVEPTGTHPVWRDEAGLVGLACYRDGERTALGPGSEAALVVTLQPADLPATVVDNAFRKLESLASLAGWRFEAKPETVRVS